MHTSFINLMNVHHANGGVVISEGLLALLVNVIGLYDLFRIIELGGIAAL